MFANHPGGLFPATRPQPPEMKTTKTSLIGDPNCVPGRNTGTFNSDPGAIYRTERAQAISKGEWHT